MAEIQPNPYESPQSVTAEPRSHVNSRILWAVGRILMMGLTGFVSFLSIALLYLVLATSFELDIFPSLEWALMTAGIGAVIFLGSEFFNVGQDRITRFVPRMLIACCIFVGSGFPSSILVERLGWRTRTYAEDPYWLHVYVLWIVVYFVVIAAGRLLYAATSYSQLHKPNRDRNSERPNKV